LINPAQVLDTLAQAFSGAAAKDIEIKTAEDALKIVLDFAPELEIGIDSARLLLDLFVLLREHTAKKPGLSQLPGPALEVRYPAKF
jgi:hypothetical protein